VTEQVGDPPPRQNGSAGTGDSDGGVGCSGPAGDVKRVIFVGTAMWEERPPSCCTSLVVISFLLALLLHKLLFWYVAFFCTVHCAPQPFLNRRALPSRRSGADLSTLKTPRTTTIARCRQRSLPTRCPSQRGKQQRDWVAHPQTETEAPSIRPFESDRVQDKTRRAMKTFRGRHFGRPVSNDP